MTDSVDQAQHRPAPPDAAIPSTINEAMDAAALAHASFSDLSGLFRAIKRLTEKHSDAHNLAVIGQYLADDWGTLNGCYKEVISGCLNELRAVKNSAEQKTA